jgi:hypothetical protein
VTTTFNGVAPPAERQPKGSGDWMVIGHQHTVVDALLLFLLSPIPEIRAPDVEPRFLFQSKDRSYHTPESV